MGSIWGRQLKISLFGESHGAGIGIVMDGLPAGEPLDLDQVQAVLNRRAPGRAPWSTARKEVDQPEILSGFYQGKTTGTPLALIIRNTDTRSGDYENLMLSPRPGHADLTGMMRYQSANDPRGGGHFSARLTAPLTAAGAIAMQILKRRGVNIAAHIARIGEIEDEKIDAVSPDTERLLAVQTKRFPVLDEQRGEQMIAAVEQARQQQDSVGGVVELAAWGIQPGIGDPLFGGLEPVLASLYFAIPAVKGVEFGAGFDVAKHRGSDNNDAPEVIEKNGKKQVRMHSNHAGGADGGISTGMPLLARLAFKPTPSIAKTQQTIDLRCMENTELEIKGRHDPCIVPRAVPVAEAATAIGLLDCYLIQLGTDR